ncbi:MAG: helix-turn-helix transcriptional regulator [Bacteroidales bacterium]|nr:helix-turn-helix transcriptional regulator [Bacteroidales bacterium]
MPKWQKGMIVLKTEQRIDARVIPQQKKKIAQIAEKCGLSQSEYIRQRALGYSPRVVLPDAFYLFHTKLCELCNSIDGKVSADAEEKLLCLIDDIQSELLLPGKETIAQIKAGLERDATWQPQDSGQLKES